MKRVMKKFGWAIIGLVSLAWPALADTYYIDNPSLICKAHFKTSFSEFVTQDGDDFVLEFDEEQYQSKAGLFSKFKVGFKYNGVIEGTNAAMLLNWPEDSEKGVLTVLAADYPCRASYFKEKPIQMANFTSAIANRGFFIQPHFVKKINNQPINKKDKKLTTIDKENFEIVIDGMVDVVDRGTARIAKIKGINVAGKTGTVENFILIEDEKKQLTDHSTFIAFAPAENPKIVVSVFIENGYWGSRWAAPIASLIIEKYLNKNVERKWLESRMLNGSLVDEYEKPYKYKNFSINE